MHAGWIDTPYRRASRADWPGRRVNPLGRPKVSNPEPGGRPTVQKTAGSGDPRRTANLKSGGYSRPVPNLLTVAFAAMGIATSTVAAPPDGVSGGDWPTYRHHQFLPPRTPLNLFMGRSGGPRMLK